MEAETNKLIVVGRITATHGIRGQVRFHSYSGNLDNLKSAETAFLRLADGSMLEISIKQVNGHGSKVLLGLSGYDSIEVSSPLISSELLLHRDQLPEPEADEFYWHELIGMTVVTDDGQKLGKLSEIMETGANDVYVVKAEDSKREYLIPAIASVVSTIDLDEGCMVITPLEGLLDL